MSQQMTFLYLSQLGNRSSWPVTKPTASISKVWWPGRTPNLDMTIAPTTDVGGYGFVTARMHSKHPKMTLYKEAYWPQSVSQSEFGSQSALTRESPTALDLAETSTLDSAWHIVPFKDESTLS